MLRRLHAAAGGLALLTLLSFWVSTLMAELLLGRPAVAAVKGAVVAGLFILVPTMAVAGMTGAALARGRGGGPAGAKAGRMRVLAANGVLVMIPAALFLDMKAGDGEIDGLFVLVQAAELAVGALQIRLMVLNVRDGLRLSGRPAPRLFRFPG